MRPDQSGADAGVWDRKIPSASVRTRDRSDWLTSSGHR